MCRNDWLYNRVGRAMEHPDPADVTELLQSWSSGDRSALDELTPLVYGELRRIAAGYLRRERPDHTLQPTALVHEAYLKLIDQADVKWQNRAQFFSIAATLILAFWCIMPSA